MLSKSNFIQPIFKFGNSSNFENYRPILILSTILKVFESLQAPKLTLYSSIFF